MLRNYLTVVLRNLVRHKLYSAITVSGLAVGLACAIFISLFVRDELSFDRWLPGVERLYRLEETINIPGRPAQDVAVTAFALPKVMAEEIPEVTGFTRLIAEGITLNHGAMQFVESTLAVDPHFFTMIRIPLSMGDPERVLAQPQSVVLSETTARKYFGVANPLGQILTVSRPPCPADTPSCSTEPVALTVTGVFKDIPINSQLSGDVIIPNTSSADSFSKTEKADWEEQAGWGYVTLAPGADPDTVIAKLNPILDRELGPGLRRINERVPGHTVNSIHLTPFLRVHLDSARYAFNLTQPGSWTLIVGLVAIGGAIMLMACFNFMNLATAQASLRSREIAVRKAFGARRVQLVTQFLGEAILLALLALVFAIALEEVLLSPFNSFMRRSITFGRFEDWPMLLILFTIAITAGLLSGIYPALILSGFRPASILRGSVASGGGSGLLRKGLVIIQFSVTIALGIVTLVVFAQIGHDRKVDLGFQHDNVVILGSDGLTVTARESMVEQLARYPGIEAVGQSFNSPFGSGQALGVAQMPGISAQVPLYHLTISPSFRSLYRIPLLAGRDLSHERTDDQYVADHGFSDEEGRNILINAAAAARFGLNPAQMIGKTITFNGGHVVVVGVIGDIRLQGAHESVRPTLYYAKPLLARVISIRVRPNRLPDTLAFIDRTWHAFSPTTAVSRFFLDDLFAQLYSTEERQGRIFSIFVGLAIFIAVLGLFGLAAFTAGRRTKEIGLRKVFGARTIDVILLLLRQFSMPVLVANVIAWPIAWYYLNRWLQGFADRISLNLTYFVAVGVVALVVAWATIFAHTLRVARANPVQALRHE
jgi:putative ABC transport system permease protein